MLCRAVGVNVEVGVGIAVGFEWQKLSVKVNVLILWVGYCNKSNLRIAVIRIFATGNGSFADCVYAVGLFAVCPVFAADIYGSGAVYMNLAVSVVCCS